MNDCKQVGRSPSSEVANRFRSCRDLSDIVSLYPPRALYLKPLAKVNVSVSLPQLKTPGNTISTWEVMEKIRALILPDEFASLKVAKSTLEFIRLEGDLRDRCRLPRVLARLDSQNLNLAGFASVLKVRVAEAKDDFPTRHSWDSYFRDAKHMNELKPGERPDTIHITGLPVKWFVEEGSNTPSESLISNIFKKWGILRRIDVPAADAYRSRMRLSNNINKFSYEDGVFFDAYIQYIEYMDFVKAMTALRGMKLLKKDDQDSMTATIKVDFDKTKHMSDNSVSHREFERKRLIAQDNLAAERLRKKAELEKKLREEEKKKEEADSIAKADRRRKREEKRKRKALTVFRKQEEDKVSMKIAREEQKLIKAQRQLESIRLLDELFDRIKMKAERKEINLNQTVNTNAKRDEKTNNDRVNESVNKTDPGNDKKKKEAKKKKKEKKKKRKRKRTQRKQQKDDGSDSGSTTEDSDKETNKKKIKSILTKNVSSSASSRGAATNFPYPDAYSDTITMPGLDMLRIPMSRYQSIPLHHHSILSMLYRGGGHHRGSGFSHGRGGRGFNSHHMKRNFGGSRRSGGAHLDVNSYALTNPYIYDEQYYKYFAHLAGQDESSDRRRRSASRSRSRTKTRSLSETRSRNVSRSRSRRRSASRSNNRGSARSRSKSKSKSRSSRSRSARDSRSRRKSRSASDSRTSTRTSSRTKSRRRSDGSRTRSCGSRSRSKSRSYQSRSKRRSRDRSRSHNDYRNRYRKKRSGRSASTVRVTRAKSRTISPKRRSRSSSWSMPKSPDRRSCSWSKTVPSNVDEDTNKVIQEKTAVTQKEAVTN